MKSRSTMRTWPTPAADQGVGQHGAEGAAAAQGHPAVEQLALARFADAVEAHLPAVAFEGNVGHASFSVGSLDPANSPTGDNCSTWLDRPEPQGTVQGPCHSSGVMAASRTCLEAAVNISFGFPAG